jgi:2-keto-4-pentenoate hydratase/2-oxohepta-3-ene-1,7-dioic acid hydratase in catechol pathway
MSSWSRLVRFNPVSNPSQILIGEPVDSSLDVGLASFSKLPISINVYSGSSILSAGSPLPGRVEEVAQLLSPLAEGEVGSIRCIGLNYTKHAVECKLPIPEVPILFLKPSSSLTGPWPAKIVVPKFTVADDTADYESEMTIVRFPLFIERSLLTIC